MTGNGACGPDTLRDESRRIAASGRRAGKSLREIAVDLYGAARVEAEWTGGGWMRPVVRRLVRRGRERAA